MSKPKTTAASAPAPEHETVAEPVELVTVEAPALDALLLQLEDVVRNIQGDARTVAIRVRDRLVAIRKGDR